MSNTNVVRTAMAGILQTCQYTGKKLEVFPNSTLNQKLSIHADVQLIDTDMPHVRYVGIGDGGHDFLRGGNGKTKWVGVHHTPRHTAMYNQLPFVLRPIGEDLTPEQRVRYRLRKVERHHGVDYIAYYLRVLDMSLSRPALELRVVEDGVTTSTPFVPSLEDLNPVPPVLVTDNAVTTTGDYVASTMKVPFIMTPEDVTEFINACRIRENEDGYGIISELVTVSGVDKTVNGAFNGVNQSYTEAVYAQVTAFVATAWVMDSLRDGTRLNLDIGNVEPLLTVSN